MKPTPEQIKQMAIECGGFVAIESVTYRLMCLETVLTPAQLQAFFTRAYELGWKDRGESYTDIMTKPQIMFDEVRKPVAVAIRNNTGE